jgi:hypothetical protein
MAKILLRAERAGANFEGFQPSFDLKARKRFFWSQLREFLTFLEAAGFGDGRAIGL